MKILGASKLFCCDEGFSIIDNGGVMFEGGKILDFATFETLKAKYPQAKASFYPESVLLPALSNPHIHFEFSNNKTTLVYGDFGEWLDSVIEKREGLFEDLQNSIQREIDNTLKSGIASVGAISSYGFDIAPLSASPLRVQLFNEAIGSNPALIDALYSNLLARLQESDNHSSGRFYPALSIHSPYSTHKLLAQKVSELAKERDLLLSVHFLESKHELEWLNHSSGFFKSFFAKHFGNPNATSTLTPSEFLSLIEGNKALFVHCLFADSSLLEQIHSLGGKVISSPRSNRLLNNAYLDLDKLKSIGLPTIISTDGLSSNFSLSLLDELRYTLFAYPQYSPDEFAKELILSVTKHSNQALGFNGGEIAIGKDADLALFDIREISQSSQEALSFILHSQKAQELYINGIREYTNDF